MDNFGSHKKDDGTQLMHRKRRSAQTHAHK